MGKDLIEKVNKNKVNEIQNIPQEIRDLQLNSVIDAGTSSYAQSIFFWTLLLRSFVTKMDQLTTVLCDYEKIDMQRFQKMEASFLRQLLAKMTSTTFSKLESFQFDGSITSGMQGMPEHALLKIASAKKVCNDVLACIKVKISTYGGRLGTLYSCDAESGGTGCVAGRMTQFLINWIYNPEINIGITTLTSPSDGIKFGNKQITLANALSRNYPNKDIVFLQDNRIADSTRPIGKIDLRHAAAIEGIRKGKSLKGKGDFTDRTAYLRENGNGIVMTSATTVPLATRPRFLRSKAINKNIMAETLAQTFTELATPKGFERYGHIKARCVQPAYFGIYGKIPETIVLEAADSADLGKGLDILYVPTTAFGEELLLFGVYTTTHSIDSIDTLFAMPLDGVRKADRFDQLLPRDIMEDFASRVFPNSKYNTDFMTVNDRIAKVCGVEPEEVLKTI